MHKATSFDKQLVVNILTKAFFDNKSFNLIVRQDDNKNNRIQKIFDYYFDIHISAGFIYISDDNSACAMISCSDKRKESIKSIFADIKLLYYLGIRTALKGFKRERVVAEARTKSRYYYLLFLGVHPDKQGMGIGSNLMREILNNKNELDLPICLETSLIRNVEFYSKLGFYIYHEMQFGFPLYFMVRDFL